MNSPVFVVGAERSGSTFLRLMLDSHPNISNPGEFDFLFDQMTDSGVFPDLDYYHHWLSSNRIFLDKQLVIDPDLDYPDLIRSFVSQCHREGKVLSMNLHRHFQRIPYVFPNARYIHLLRDGRDVARSCIGMGWVGHVYFGIDVWRDAENSWEATKNSLSSEQYIDVRYEDLLENIESGLAKICRFLGVPYSSAMLDYVNKSTYGAPDKALSYQWRKKYTQRELQLVEGKVGRMLLDRGYELSGEKVASPGVVESARLAIFNKSFRVRELLSRYGFSLYFQQLISRRLGIRWWQDSCQAKMNVINRKLLK